MPSNIGSQTVTVKFFDPVNSATVVDKIALDVRKPGIYTGGYLTKLNNATCQLSPLTCEIGDGTYQVRVQTGAAISTVPISSGAPYIVLRWTYTGSAAADYMDFTNVALVGILSTDIVVGKGTFIGASLQTTFDYTLRTTPNVSDLFLKVEPTVAASMNVRIRRGRINQGVSNLPVPDQLSTTFIAPISNPRIDVVYVDTDGAVKVYTGTENAVPVAPSYSGKIVLAEISLVPSQTSITSTSITDVRSALVAPLLNIRGSKILLWFVGGEVEVVTRASGRPYIDFTGTITSVKANVKTAPTGSSLTIDIKKNGVTIMSSPLTLVAGATIVTSTALAQTSAASGDYFDIDITGIGSTTPGENLTVLLYITPTA